jgi:hypothetical protein
MIANLAGVAVLGALFLGWFWRRGLAGYSSASS